MTTRLVARVLPGFECRSGVLGHFVRRCLSHELGKDSRLGPPSSFCTSFFAWKQTGTARHLLQSRFCVEFWCETRRFPSSLARAVNPPRTSPYSSSESWRRPVGLNWTAVGKARPVYTSALRVSVPRGSRWLRMRSMAVTSRGGFATLLKGTHACNIPCTMSKRLERKSGHGETRHRDTMLSATCLTCASHRTTRRHFAGTLTLMW